LIRGHASLSANQQFNGRFQSEEQLVKNRHPGLFFELVYALSRMRELESFFVVLVGWFSQAPSRLKFSWWDMAGLL
jgi:hypothetical protein